MRVRRTARIPGTPGVRAVVAHRGGVPGVRRVGPLSTVQFG